MEKCSKYDFTRGGMMADWDEKPARKPGALSKVAKLAGVSIGTVSRVFNNSGQIPAETRNLVMNAARELGFRPRVGVRRKQIALVTEPPGKSVMGGYVNSMMQYISYQLSLADVGLSVITEDRVGRLQDCWFDGIIGIAWEEATVELLRTIRNVPVVWLSENYAADFNVVYCDGIKTGHMLGNYLQQRGHRRVAVIHDPDYTGLQRTAGVQQIIEGVGGGVVLPISGDKPLHLSVKQAIDNQCTAIWVTGVDMKVVEASWLIQELAGLRIPEDVSLVGFENPGISEFLRPSLTTVVSPLEEIARKAVELVLNANANDGLQRIELQETLLERHSVRNLNL